VLAIMLGRVADVAVAPAWLLQVELQVSYSSSFCFSSSCLSAAPGYPYVLAEAAAITYRIANG